MMDDVRCYVQPERGPIPSVPSVVNSRVTALSRSVSAELKDDDGSVALMDAGPTMPWEGKNVVGACILAPIPAKGGCCGYGDGFQTV